MKLDFESEANPTYPIGATHFCGYNEQPHISVHLHLPKSLLDKNLKNIIETMKIRNTFKILLLD